MSFDTSAFVWLNGRLVAWGDATTHVSAHGLHYGSGVFEGIRVYETDLGPAAFRLDSHLGRLFASAAAYDIEVPFTSPEIARAVAETVEANGLSHCYVRIVCSLGSRSLGLHTAGMPTDVAVLAWPWGPLQGEEAAERGLRLTVSPWRKVPACALPPTAKACGQYLSSQLAVTEAKRRGFDEALLLAPGGEVAEAAAENVFAVQRGRLVTNDERSPILLGVTRDSVLRIARDLGIGVDVRALLLDDLRRADEVFLTGTAAEVAPVAELDGELVGGGAPGPVTRLVQQSFRAATRGLDPRYRHWLTPTTAGSLAAHTS